jgi:hypothetical protein
LRIAEKLDELEVQNIEGDGSNPKDTAFFERV